MKVIDLLDKIANGEHIVIEENPNIKLIQKIFSVEDIETFVNQEIIEDNNKIKKIEIDNMDRIKATSTGNFVYSVSQPMKIMIKKINEIIDKLEKMDK